MPYRDIPKKVIFFTVLAILCLSLISTSKQVLASPPSGKHRSDGILLSTGMDFSVLFEGNNPHMKLFLSELENQTEKSHYKILFKSLIEYEDLDENGIYDMDVAPGEQPKDSSKDTFSLESALWSHTDIKTGQDSSGGFYANVNFTTTRIPSRMENLSVTISVWVFEKTLTKVYTLNQTVTTNTTGNQSMTSVVPTTKTVVVFGGLELKFTITIMNWFFEAKNHRLALETEVISSGGQEVSQEGNDTIKASSDQDSIKMRIPDFALADGVIVPVAWELYSVGNKQKLQFSFPSFSKELEYDPMISISRQTGLPGFDLNILVLTLTPALIWVRRKRKSH